MCDMGKWAWLLATEGVRSCVTWASERGHSPSRESQSGCELGCEEMLRARYSNSTEDESTSVSCRTCSVTSPAS